MAGWIKISREIVSHWVWQDAERLKWWFDLLFMASWEDKQVLHDAHLFTLRRGQMIASISFLSERWKRNHQTVIKYLKLLEEEEMIKREVLYRQTPILTICNYDRYQLQVDTIVDRQTDRQIDEQVDAIIDGNKEYKNINNNSTTSIGEAEKKFIEEMKRDTYWCEVMAMRFHLGAIEPLFGWLDKFVLDLQCREVTHRDLGDAKRHFNDWLRIQLQNERKNGNSNGKSKSEAGDQKNKRRSFEVSATSEEDYSTSF